MSNFPCKPITLDSYTFQLHGISSNDHYWKNHVQNDFEPEFQRLCRRLIRPDYVCLDIGANIGTKTLYLSRICPEGRVIAVEAGKIVAECLATNITANDASNAIMYHAAAAAHDGTLAFTEGSAWGHTAIDHGGSQVEAATLETITARHKLTRLDFIKIDIEGGELPVLKSSLDLINRFGSLVYVEFNSLTLLVWGNTNPREFIEWICANFRYVYALNRGDQATDMLTPVASTDACRAILHRNLIDDGCVTDLVISNAEHRFTPTLAYLEQRHQTHLALLSQARDERDAAIAARDQLSAERDAAIAARDQLSAERDAAITNVNAIRASTSWRVTAPMRRVARFMR